MKRKMIGAAAAYMSGLFFASFFTGGSDWLLLAGLFPVFFIISRTVKLRVCDTVLIAAFFAVSFTVGECCDRLVYRRITAYNETVGSFTGKVLETRYLADDMALYTLEGEINDSCKARIIVFSDAYSVEYGDVMSFNECRFVVPESDYLFDTEGYYRSEQIFLEADNPVVTEIIRTDGHFFRRAAASYRESVISDFRVRLGEEKGTLLSGMVFGETQRIEQNTKSLLYRCGIGHILSVSGLHVSLIAALLMKLLKKLRINRYLSFGLLNVFLFVMIILVQSPVSAVRAAIMLDIMYGAALFRRQNDSFNSLSAAVLIICISNPYVVLDRGFLLSVAGTFAIAVWAPYMTSKMKSGTFCGKLMKSIAEMTCVTLAVFPLSILYFDETSVISPLMNVFLAPLCVGAMICGMVYVFTAGLISLLSVAEILSAIILKAAEFTGESDFVHVSCGSDRLFVISIFCAVFVIAVQAVGRKRRYTAMAVASAVTVFIFSSAIYSTIVGNSLRAAVLGRGSNAAIVVTLGKRTDVIDLSGHYKSPDYVRKYLAANGITQIDSLVLTENIQSQYAAYHDALELVETVDTYILSETSVYAASDTLIPFTEDSLVIENSSYRLEYSGGTLIISCGSRTLTIAHVSDYTGDSDESFVYYGRITSKTKIEKIGRDAVFLDKAVDFESPYCGVNNIEITIPSEGGDLSIRRL